MNNWSLRNGKLGVLARQCINCWLGYVLSQPVDIDLPVLSYLVKEYVGISVANPRSSDDLSYYSVPVSGDKKEKSIEEIIV